MPLFESAGKKHVWLSFTVSTEGPSPIIQFNLSEEFLELCHYRCVKYDQKSNLVIGQGLKMATIVSRLEIKDAILDATERLLARYGYRKMTVEDIAREVGVGKGTIYLHFPSKEEVVLSHVDRIVERVKERLRAIAASNSTAAVRLRLMLLSRVLFRFDSIQLYTQNLNDLLAALRPGLLARRARYYDEEAQILVDVLNQGRDAGEFEFGDTLSTAYALLHATNSLLPYSLSTSELGEREEVEEKTAAVADLILHGLLRPKADAATDPGMA